MNLFYLFLASLFFINVIHAEADFTSESLISHRLQENEEVRKKSLRIIPLYDLDLKKQSEDITGRLLNSTLVLKKHKAIIKEQGRKIILFRYPSDGLEIKGYISYIPKHTSAPLLMLLRGGAKNFGLQKPANSLSLLKNYTVIATTYRGGINPGVDQYGGEDVKDVLNLVKFIPQLEKTLGIKLSPSKKFLLGSSRGGRQGFLALQRYPYLQKYFDKAVADCSPMDLRITAKSRDEMKKNFIDNYGLIYGVNDSQWFDLRNPISQCEKFLDDFPLLIIQGTEDNRVCLEHGRSMVSKLKKLKKNVTYFEIENGGHTLFRSPHFLEKLCQWLES